MKIPGLAMALLASGQMLTATGGAARRDPHQRTHRKGHTRGGPACPVCRVTLSHNKCLNRMCKAFVGVAA
jgi:hypothetical protein